MLEIAIGRDFSSTPGGRYRRHGKGSGEEFREKYLLPHLKMGERVRVILDETAGYPPSFLEEAFGGLVRSGIRHAQLLQLLEITPEGKDNEVYSEEAWQYIREEEVRGNRE